MREVGHAPAHLCGAIAIVRERHDQVVVGLRHRVAVAEPLCTRTVCFDERGEHIGRMGTHPPQQGRSEIEADVVVGANPQRDRAITGHDAGCDVGPVAFLGDAVVPVERATPTAVE